MDDFTELVTRPRTRAVKVTTIAMISRIASVARAFL